ncbi:hypothetical protein [Lewinella cohaerens]|uniref:hypothetical protein n=1 Tax=Lewinella cohaerens TaxID=70995 RepID=UPI00036C7378|nr:hypothetical protein [Lewinella cohaerens]
MNLVNTKTGNKINGKIKRLSSAKVKKLKEGRKFDFDWSLEQANEVYAIVKSGSTELLGLISLIDVSEELRIHINLIESAIPYRGKGKQIDGIPGCLIGFACEMSFKKGYDGFVSLTPKTRLVNYYQEKFGFLMAGKSMVVFLDVAQSIIKKYLKDE